MVACEEKSTVAYHRRGICLTINKDWLMMMMKIDDDDDENISHTSWYYLLRKSKNMSL